jgi:thioredoxin 1
MSDLVLHTSDSTFEQDIINAELPVLLDFWAPWCGPCKMIAPILDEVAQEYTGKVVVAKLNIDENPAQPPKFGVRGIPTLMLLKSGQVVATRVGALSKSQLTDFLNSNLA